MCKRCLAAVLALLLLIALAGCSGQGCPCGCRDCVCGGDSETLFAFSKDHLLNVVGDVRGQKVYLEGSKAEEALDMLNAFVPVSEEEMPEMLGGDYSVTINYYDMQRVITFDGDGVKIGNTRYTGGEGCLEGLAELLREELAAADS